MIIGSLFFIWHYSHYKIFSDLHEEVELDKQKLSRAVKVSLC